MKKNSGAVWERSKSHILTGKPKSSDGKSKGDVLSCKPMTKSEGVHIWSIEVVKDDSRRLLMGVTSFNNNIFDSYLLYDGRKSCKVRRDTDGAITWDTISGFPSFCTGSIITFRLDLTGSGTLSAQVNKDSINEFVLFENVLREGEEVVDKNFFPAAAIEASGAINFLGFETA
jgi:hypothetical protein